MVYISVNCSNRVTGMQVMPAPKARKTAKTRRHTSASRISNSGTSFEAPFVNAGRPSAAGYIA